MAAQWPTVKVAKLVNRQHVGDSAVRFGYWSHICFSISKIEQIVKQLSKKTA